MIIEQTKNGILNVDKPQCITSHDVVDAIRKIFPNQRNNFLFSRNNPTKQRINSVKYETNCF